MNSALIKGVQTLVSMGGAYMHHLRFTNLALSAPQSERSQLLGSTLATLSPTALIGFKATLYLIFNRETDVHRKAALQALLRLANGGLNEAPALQRAPTPAGIHSGTANGFDRDLALIAPWCDELNEEQREKALVKHLLTLDASRYQAFVANLRQFKENALERIRQHKANEDNAWGPYIEDRMSYRLARASTGQRDPQPCAGCRSWRNAPKNTPLDDRSDRARLACDQRAEAAGAKRQGRARVASNVAIGR